MSLIRSHVSSTDPALGDALGAPSATPLASPIPFPSVTPLQSPLFRDPLYGPDLSAAYAYARRFGLSPDDSEDCALAFLLFKLSRGKPFDQERALCNRCAHDFACDQWRSHQRRRRREVLTSDEDAIDAPKARPLLAEMPTPEQEALHSVAWNLMQSLLLLLAPLPRQVFWRHHFEGEEIAVIALSLGKTACCIEQMLWRTRRRLRDLLRAAGMEAADLLVDTPLVLIYRAAPVGDVG